MKTKFTSKFIMLILSVVMIATLFVGMSITASAEDAGATTDYTSPAADEAKIYGANVNLGGDISMKYYVELGEYVEIDTVKLRTVFLGVEKYLTAAETPVLKDGRTLYVFTLDSITPQCMGDPIDAELWIGESKLTCADSSMTGYSVKDNLVNIYNKDDTDAATKQLIIDTLEYGAAAQIYRGYKTNALVTADFAAANTDNDVAVPESHYDFSANGYTVTDLNATVHFSNTVLIKVNYTDPDSLMEMTLPTNPIAPYNFATKHRFDNGWVLFYSVNDYCYAVATGDYNNNVKSLALALYNYGLSAHNVKENHFGGTATCTEKAKCDFCGIAYGELAPLSHASTEFTYTNNGDGTHNTLYACCGVTSVESEAHTFDSTTGKCVCGHEMAEAKVTSGDVNTYFETLASALNASKSGDTVTLCRGVDLGTTAHTIPEGVIFRGGEYTVTGSGAGWVYNYGIIENGIFAFYVENRGTVNGGEFTSYFHNYGTVHDGSFVHIEFCFDSTLSGTVNIANNGDLHYRGECTIDLSNAVFGDGVILYNGTEQDLTISSLKLPDDYAVEYNGAVVSVLPADKEGYFVSHTHAYEDKNNDTHHWMECVCGKTTEKAEHSFTYANDGDTHTATCSGCAYSKSEAHTLTYSASGSTITVACSANCGYTGTATVSVTGKTYDGFAVEATVAKTGILENEPIAITYAIKNGAALEGAPANAGTYTASITLGGQTVSVDFTIAKADPTYTVPTGLTAYLGQTLADVALPDGWAWEDSTLSVGEVGENTFNAVFTPADANNYDTVTKALTVSVSKSAATVTTNPAAAANLKYTGDAQALVTAGTANGGEVQYKLGENGTYSANIPTAIDAGTYTVYWKVVGDDEHSDTAEQSITVSITEYFVIENKVNVTGYNDSYTYTGEAVKPTITVTVNGKVLVEDTDYVVTYDESTYVGEKEITITFKGNYAGWVTKTFVIVQDPSTEEFDGPWVPIG